MSPRIKRPRVIVLTSEDESSGSGTEPHNPRTSISKPVTRTRRPLHTVEIQGGPSSPRPVSAVRGKSLGGDENDGARNEEMVSATRSGRDKPVRHESTREKRLRGTKVQRERTPQVLKAATDGKAVKGRPQGRWWFDHVCSKLTIAAKRHMMPQSYTGKEPREHATLSFP